MFKEYPKALYQGGDVAAELSIVHDEDQEQQARAAGFASAGEAPTERTAKKRKEIE
jgi:hypothetical protein